MKFLRIRFSALVLAVMLFVTILPIQASANSSTTTNRKFDMSAHTEIYVQSSIRGSDYPVYGALWEPDGGVLYGRNAHGGTREDGSFGIVNLEATKRESMTSVYYYPTDDYSLEYWGYLYRPVLESGHHGLLVYMNFLNEGDDCDPLVAGSYDARLIETFEYLKTLDCPVFMRIGGEMNVFQKAAPPKKFIPAYRHIVDIGRRIAPNVAYVFSPNYSSSWLADMDDWYPGDNYVDWVGCSLYYNKGIEVAGKDDAFYGVGDIYGDPMLNIQQTVALSKLHNKPIMITEGGSYSEKEGVNFTNWAAERFQKAFAFLPMVYPQIKAIVTSDYAFGDGVWEFWNNDKMSAWYSKGVQGTGVYLEDYHDKGKYLTAMSAGPDILLGTPEGDVVFTAYTYSSKQLSASWYLDGKEIWSTSEYPYMCTVDRSILTGTHTIMVGFTNGETKSYKIVDGKVGAARTTPVPAAQTAPAESWSQSIIESAAASGLIPEKFLSDCDKPLTRAEFCELAVGIYNKAVGDIYGKISFDDTDDSNVQEMCYLGVVNGIGNGKFNPDGNVTREQAAVMLARLAKAMGHELPAGSVDFADKSSISAYAVDSVGQVKAAGIMSGDGNNFKPGGIYTRELAIVTFMRMYNLVGIEGAKIIDPDDLDAAWAGWF